MLQNSHRYLSWNLKKNGIKLKLSGEVHFYLSNTKISPKSQGWNTTIFAIKSRYLVSKHQKFIFGKFNNFTYHSIDLLTLNKKVYYSFFWKSIFAGLQGVKRYTNQEVNSFLKYALQIWRKERYSTNENSTKPHMKTFEYYSLFFFVMYDFI